MTETRASSAYSDPELYDLVYGWYTEDVPFYTALARDAGGPVLEVGCGTGRILIPALQAGADIDGLDLEEPMLAALRTRAKALGLSPHLVRADMRDFTMPRRYALVTIPFRAFLHNLTTADQVATLRCCREHLEHDGRLVLNVFHPAFEIVVATDGKPRLEQEVDDPRSGSRVRVECRTTYDRVDQTLTTVRDVIFLDTAGAERNRIRYDFRLHWVYKAEMELLLRAAGFQRFDVRGGFDGRPLEKDTDEMVWTAWRD